jgi:uncharacterized LabA/DUF88 family protein
VQQTAPARPNRRAVVFVDGQNLYHSVREAFNRSHPDYDVQKLANAVCISHDCYVGRIHFYTGMPGEHVDPRWHGFWSKKLRAMKNAGVRTFRRDIRYRTRHVKVGDGVTIEVPTADEKGIDVRIAIDCIRSALDDAPDVVVLFTQDQDLSEVADEVKKIGRLKGREIKVASAFPDAGPNKRGVNNTDWWKFDLDTYNKCVDPTDYRPARR